MGDALVALGGALLAAGVLARPGRRVGLPTIPFFMAAGILLGPNTPGHRPRRAPEDLELLATLGLILLLFHLGLEFSLGDLRPGGASSSAPGRSTCCSTWAAASLFGLALGWGTAEALVIAGAVGISSSAIVTKLLVELRRLANPESRLILGIIVVEDIFLALYLAFLQPILGDAEGLGDSCSSSSWPSPSCSRWRRWPGGASRFVGRLVDTPDDELLTVCFLGPRRAGGRGGRGARRVRRHRRLHGRPDPGREPGARADRAAGAARCGTPSPPCSSSPSASPSTRATPVPWRSRWRRGRAVTLVLNVVAGLIAARLPATGRRRRPTSASPSSAGASSR